MAATSILIVEDDQIIALDLEETLIAQQFQVLASVPSGEKALETAERLKPELVLMDIRLAGTLTGLETAKILRDTLGIPSLFLTSYFDKEMLRQAKECGGFGYLIKPYSERDLLIAIDMALHRIQVDNQLRNALSYTPNPRGETESPIVAEESAATPGDLPLLQIRTLGTIELRLDGRLLQSKHLSRSQRDMLAISLASPQTMVHRSEIELALWPDSPGDRSRSSFDSLLMRLRKTLHGVLRTDQEKSYACFRRGMLSFENYDLDATTFVKQADRANEFFKKNQKAAALARYTQAVELWKGEFMPGTLGNETTELFRSELNRTFVHCCRQLGTLLAEQQRLEEATAILQRAIDIDRSNDGLIADSYQLLLQTNSLNQAGALLKRYVARLNQEGFGEEEISQAVQEITKGKRQ